MKRIAGSLLVFLFLGTDAEEATERAGTVTVGSIRIRTAQ